MAEVQTEDKIPSYDQKKFIEYSIAKPGSFNGIRTPNITLADVDKAGSLIGANEQQRQLASQLSGIGLGGMSVSQFNQSLGDVNFVQQYGLGKTFSYSDLAAEALSTDPNFDPNDDGAISSFAQDLEKRKLDNTKREDIRTLATTQSTQRQIDKAVNPGKYLTSEQTTANQATAQRLAQQFGQDDPDLVQFLSDRIAEGESAFELSQFLQTTPQYLKKQSDDENARVQTESAAARQALDAELLKSEEETFTRATPKILSAYMKAGRLDSSGLQSTLAQTRADLAKERQGFLANAAYSDSIRAAGYKREDFVGANSQAFSQYLRQNEPAYQQRLNLQDVSNNLNYQQPFNNLERYYNLNDQSRARQYEIEDYDRQQSDFNRYLSDSRKQSREAALYGLLGQGIKGGIQGLLM